MRRIYIGDKRSKTLSGQTVTNLTSAMPLSTLSAWTIDSTAEGAISVSSNSLCVQSLVTSTSEVLTYASLNADYLSNLGASTIGHHYYTRVKFRAYSEVKDKPQVYIYISDVDTARRQTAVSNNGTQTTVSSTSISTTARTIQLVRLGMYCYDPADKVYFDSVEVYDLTAIFGANNEPTKAWCDEYISNRGVLPIGTFTFDGRARKVKAGYVGASQKHTVSNLITNGTFNSTNQITNWTNNATGIFTASYDSGLMKLEKIADGSGNSLYAMTSNSFTTTSGHVYFCRVGYRQPATNVENKLSIGLTGSGTYSTSWIQYEQIDRTTPATSITYATMLGTCNSTKSNSALNIYVRAGVGTTGDVLYIDNVSVIDLTIAFGAGNEPDLDWCNEHFTATTQWTQYEIARKLKKGYIGDANNKAQLFYHKQETLDYSSTNIFPTTGWYDPYAGQSNEGRYAYCKSDYGLFKVDAGSGDTASIANPTLNIVDGNTDTYWLGAELTSDSTYHTVYFRPPSIMTVCPTSVSITGQRFGDYNGTYTAKLYGYNPQTGSGVQLCTFSYCSSKTTRTVSISTEDYYSYFYVRIFRYSSSYTQPYFYNFVLNGTIKIN